MEPVLGLESCMRAWLVVRFDIPLDSRSLVLFFHTFKLP